MRRILFSDWALRSYICIAIFLFLLTIANGKEKEKETQHSITYRTRFAILARGSNGWISATWDRSLPYIPKPGDRINLMTVKEVSYSTPLEAFVVSFQVENPKETREQLLKIYGMGGKWKEQMKFPK